MRAGADCPFSVSRAALRCKGLGWGCTYGAVCLCEGGADVCPGLRGVGHKRPWALSCVANPRSLLDSAPESCLLLPNPPQDRAQAGSRSPALCSVLGPCKSSPRLDRPRLIYILSDAPSGALQWEGRGVILVHSWDPGGE